MPFPERVISPLANPQPTIFRDGNGAPRPIENRLYKGVGFLFMKRILERLRNLLSGRRSAPPPPEDPYAGVRVPLKRGPGGRNASAVAELDEF